MNYRKGREMKKTTNRMIRKIANTLCVHILYFYNLPFDNSQTFTDGFEITFPKTFYYITENEDGDIYVFDKLGYLKKYVGHKSYPTQIEKTVRLCKFFIEKGY